MFERIEIRGKRGRTVPVLLTEEMTSSIDTLLIARPSFVASNNPFLFATVGEHSHFRGSDSMRKFAVDCGAKKPTLLTSTKLRKQIASLAQVVNLKDNELDSLATFLGHDLRVHTQFYRLPMDILQIARVSKLFMAAEQGRMAEFAGKQLSEITLEPEAEIEDSSCNESEQSDVEEFDSAAARPTLPKLRSKSSTLNSQTPERVGGNDEHSETLPQAVNAITRKEKRRQVSSSRQEEPSSDDENTVVTSVNTKKKRTMPKRRPWTEAEKDAVRVHFAIDIMNRHLPGRGQIEAFLSESGLDRKWNNVKDHIRNQYLL